ncbi:MAG: type II toxin-antitoxin system RelE/ParE family toxin [Pseudomonadota bacterium]
MQVDISRSSANQIKKLTKQLKIEISDTIKTLELIKSANGISSEKLSNTKDLYKIRVKNYRIVYRRISNEQIEIISIRDQQDIYNKLFGTA